LTTIEAASIEAISYSEIRRRGINMTAIANLEQNAKIVAQKLGIQKFDIYGSTVDETSAEVDSGKTKQVSAANRASITVRVWGDNQSVGITSTTDIDPVGLELALATARDASEFGVKDHIPDFSPAVLEPVVDMGDRSSSQAPVSDLVEVLLKAEKQLLASHPAIVGVPYNGLSQRDLSRFYLNSDGAIRTENFSYTSVYFYSRAEQDQRKPRSGSAYRVNRSLADLDIEGCLKEAADKTISHLDYAKITSGKYRVVFSPESFLSLMYAFSSLFNAQNILDKQSLSTIESLGTAIASPLLSLSDYELHPGNISGVSFDGEGTPVTHTSLIEAGILQNFLHSSVTAKRMNAKPTGNASIGAKVSVSPNFFCVSASELAQNSASYQLDQSENVILIDELQALHAGVQALQGSFSLPFDGWLVNGSERTSIESATIAGDIFQLLKSIIYVEPTVKVTPSGVAPQVWVEGLSITAGD
jgi:PmbA protein